MLAAGILLLSSIIAVNLLLEKSPVVIQLDGDKFKVLDIPYVYTVKEAYILLFSGFFGGLSLAQILLSLGLQSSTRIAVGSSALVPTSEIQAEKVLEGSYEDPLEDPLENSSIEEARPIRANFDTTEVLLRALEGDERKAVELIASNGGRILQNELVNSLDFSKAKVSRVLMNLERRGIITKKKYGLTNCISIADELKNSVGLEAK
jgi:uncharacterized membrane protein